MTSLRLSLRIDTPIKPTSYLRSLWYGSLALVIMLLAWLAALWLWQYVLILLVAAAVISYLALAKPILLHISQPPISQRSDLGWQLLMRTGRADELWQAQLSAATHYSWLIHLTLVMTVPYQRPFTVTIFRDQVDAEQWRQLSILAKSVEGFDQDD